MLGFSAGGVVAGSIAASIQSVVYGGATGGIFALAQERFLLILTGAILLTIIKLSKSAGAAGVAAATTAGMAAGGVVAGLAVGSFADNSSSRQQLFVKNMKQNSENAIHIYSDKIYIGLKKLPASGSILTIN